MSSREVTKPMFIIVMVFFDGERIEMLSDDLEEGLARLRRSYDGEYKNVFWQPAI